MPLFLLKCNNTHEVLEELRNEFDRRDKVLPEKRDASIVIKPNLNSNCKHKKPKGIMVIG